jgi:DNA-binding Lrp family transcriptional regulator
MSQRERDWLNWLKQAETKQITQAQAAERMGVSERWVRKLLRRKKRQGDRVVVHALRGRLSNRRLPESMRKRVLRLITREYKDFGPTLIAEYLQSEHSLALGKETIRKWMTAAELWKPKRARVGQVHMWRARRECCGELVQWDTSVHAWLEDRGPAAMYLVAMIDDATNTLYARLVESDSAEQNMRVLWGYLERHGRPQAVYTDKASLFQPTLARGWQSDDPGNKTETQIGRALREMGIEWIAAHSPQAKGRIERCFGTLQDRLVKAFRKAKVRTMPQANAYLEQVFLPVWNQRFVRKPANAVDGHRELGRVNLASSLSVMETRRVANDYTVQWRGVRWQIPREAIRPGLRGTTLRIEQRLDGTMVARDGSKFIKVLRCESEPAVKSRNRSTHRTNRESKPAPNQSRWMDGFRVKGNEQWRAYREEQSKLPVASE